MNTLCSYDTPVIVGGMKERQTKRDRQITIRMGQANVRRWTDDITPLLADGDPLDARSLVTHVVPLDDAPEWYRAFRDKEDGAIKVVFRT